MKAEHKKRCLKNEFFNSLKSGRLKDLPDIIKKDDTLQLCFRGQYISVYYKGDSLFKIEPLTNYDKICFNFNHARYTSNFDKQLDRLEKLGYEYSEGGREEKKKRRKVICKYHPHNTESGSCVFWRESIRILKSLIDDFLDLDKKHDYFKKEDKKGKSCHLERQRQQDIMRANNALNRGYFIYDMEYDQPRNSSEEDKSGRFDMLALRRILRGRYNLVFVELKSTAAACTGKSDIKKHYRDLMTYTGKSDIVTARKRDALEICNHYSLLDLVKQERVQVKDIEILFVFTDKAIKHADEIKNKKEKCILSPKDLKLKYNKGAL
jgi:hypothetical protein